MFQADDLLELAEEDGIAVEAVAGSSSGTSQPKPSSKKKRKCDADELLSTAIASLQNVTSSDSSYPFGDYIRQEMETMDSNNRLIFKKLINEALFLGNLGVLTSNAHIVYD